MNINVLKDRLIEWITQIEDTVVIEKLLIIQRKNQKDWCDDLSEHEKNEIGMGLKDLEEGNTVEHPHARKMYERYL